MELKSLRGRVAEAGSTARARKRRSECSMKRSSRPPASRHWTRI